MASAVHLPNARTIGTAAFRGCSRLSVSVSLPQVRSIGDAVFEGCTNLSRIEMPACQSIGAAILGTDDPQ